MLVIDDSGDRKDGTKTAHVGHQWLGRYGIGAYGPDAHTPVDAARALAWDGPEDPGEWRPVTRTFRAADARSGSPR